MIAEQTGQGVLVLRETAVVVVDAWLIAVILPLLEILEKKTGDVGIGGGIARPALQDVFGLKRFALLIAAAQLGQEFALQAAPRQSRGPRRSRPG